MNYIHHTAIIDPHVKLGTGNYIGPYCYVTGDTQIGNNNRLEAYCSIGTPAEHRDYFFDINGKTIIGDNNVFREFVTINAGTKDITVINNNVTMLRSSHVGHDCILEDSVNLSCNVLIGGHSYIMTGANFGLGSICHQFSVIGAYAMIGMAAVITKKSNIYPGGVYIGSPAIYLKQNMIGLQRYNIDNNQLTQLNIQYNARKL